MEKKVKVGIIGYGTVGAGVAECILGHGDMICGRTGIRLSICRVADIDTERDRGVVLPEGALTHDAGEVLDESDIVVELVGGTGKAKEFILDALSRGKHVVTANKALLAEHGNEIFAAAKKSGANVYYEGSVAGGIPIIKALREGFVGNKVEKIVGILNGTCNYILTRMERDDASFEQVLKEAQDLGYAESDPSFDIDGTDTAHKTSILASLAYGEWFGMKPLLVEGIRNLKLCDIRFASELGYRIKMLGIIKQAEGDIELRVHPALIPRNRILADVSDVFNAVMIKALPVGETLFYGRGAGRNATASAVVADIIDAALNLQFGSHRRVPEFRIGKQFKNLIAHSEIRTRYYLRLEVVDRPGVIAAVAGILGGNRVSISSFLQKEAGEDGVQTASLLILTHCASEGAVRKSTEEIKRLDCVKSPPVIIRIEDL